MSEHPLVRSVGIVLRERDPRNARVLLASLEECDECLARFQLAPLRVR